MTPIPIDIESGLPKWTVEEWSRLSEFEQRIAAYHNSPHRQRMTLLYRQIASHEVSP